MPPPSGHITGQPHQASGCGCMLCDPERGNRWQAALPSSPGWGGDCRGECATSTPERSPQAWLLCRRMWTVGPHPARKGCPLCRHPALLQGFSRSFPHLPLEGNPFASSPLEGGGIVPFPQTPDPQNHGRQALSQPSARTWWCPPPANLASTFDSSLSPCFSLASAWTRN